MVVIVHDIFSSYRENKYPVVINGENVYYSETKTTRTTRSSRIMSEEEKERFDNYKLSVCIYDQISEKNARRIFNKLQNAVPMSVQML